MASGPDEPLTRGVKSWATIWQVTAIRRNASLPVGCERSSATRRRLNTNDLGAEIGKMTGRKGQSSGLLHREHAQPVKRPAEGRDPSGDR